MALRLLFREGGPLIAKFVMVVAVALSNLTIDARRPMTEASWTRLALRFAAERRAATFAWPGVS
eukprot:5801457-Pyramimonas_sp.AAC.1